MKHSRAIFSHQDPRYIVRILDFSHDRRFVEPTAVLLLLDTDLFLSNTQTDTRYRRTRPNVLSVPEHAAAAAASEGGDRNAFLIASGDSGDLVSGAVRPGLWQSALSGALR